MSGVDNAFSIVVLGAMTPPLHHPLWYAEAGILTQLEADHALRSPGFSCTADAADFTFGALRLRCSRARWSVSTASEAALDRMLSVAVATYDRLDDLLVTGFGLNFDYLREVNVPNVPQVLAGLAQAAPLGLVPQGAEDAAIQYRRHLGGAVVTVVISPTESPRHVEVKNTYVDELAGVALARSGAGVVGKGPGRVDLGALLRTAFPIAKREAEEQLARTLHALDDAERG